ncbi:E3 ubiquitin-protein ligase TRIM7-like [Hemicordylus capensis]|uniref:E3 ubiquitin-protein ligase TRIM7-like n=1 Tax=Hemicordylus capensis TaxID=884348 RepID=UPI002302FEB6|nr:E3 ubiquitin-protein ligase TRIM7-like [Hemicordylus capensis]
MAAEGAFKELSDEATCPICLDYFKDPVTITECGHNFCQACLSQFWGETDRDASCPACRETVQPRNLIPNRQLKSVVELIKKLSLQGGKGTERKESVCEKHGEPLKLFCKDHERPICLVCDKSKEHEHHKVIPLEEASEEYQAQICSHLKILKKERKKILMYKSNAEKESRELLEQTIVEKQKTVVEFRQLHQFLEEKEKLLLTQMEEVEGEIARKRDEHLAILSKELSSLESLIGEIEEKCQQPASELLQDVKCILQRCEKENEFKNPVAFPTTLKWKIWDFCDINPFLEVVMKQFQDTLVSGLQLQKANITLDPNTAHRKLCLSEDRKSLKHAPFTAELPDNPERFNVSYFVLGCEGFTAGRHFWEVNVRTAGGWAAGIARKSVRRKGTVGFGPQEGVWSVGKLRHGQHSAWEKLLNKLSQVEPMTFDPPDSFISLSREPKRLRVSLNCAGQRLTFFDADSATLLYMFSGASFSGEILCPFFFLDTYSCLRICP